MNVSIKIIYGVVGHTQRNIYVEFNRGSSVAFVYGFKEVDKRLQVYYLIFKMYFVRNNATYFVDLNNHSHLQYSFMLCYMFDLYSVYYCSS